MPNRIIYVYTDIMQIHYSKLLCRVLLILLFSSMLYIVLLPGYNFAHFVPHAFLRSLGIPYQYRLNFEIHMDKLLHFGGAFFLLLLFYGAKFNSHRSASFRLISYFILVVLMIISAEVVQHFRGRGFSISDLLFGLAGAISGLLTIILTNKQKD